VFLCQGGSEAAITPVAFAGFCALTAMATKYNDAPEKALRPFDKNRAGFIMYE
jgi:3-oxoacyl-[acyl-carrier-protein] synthase II